MTISTLMKMAESFPNGQKTLWEKEKLLVTSNFSISYSVFKRLVLQTRKNQGLFGKGLTYVPVWNLKTQGLSFTPFIVIICIWKKNADFSFQLLILTSIHVNSLFKFSINDQETVWGSFDWTVSKWPLLYVMGFCVFFHRSILVFLYSF